MKSTVLLFGTLLLQACLLSLSATQGAGALESARKERLSGHLRSAVDAYNQAIKQDPKSVEPHVELIRTLLELDDVVAAGAAATTAISQFPDSAPVVAATGDVLFRAGKIQEAWQAYTRAVEIDVKMSRGWLGMGRVQRLSMKKKQARESFIRAHELDQRDPDIVGAWAQTLWDPVDIATALDRQIELAGYRGTEYTSRLRMEAATFRHLGNRRPCELVTPLKKVMLDIDVRRNALLPLMFGDIGFLSRTSDYRWSASVNGKTSKFYFDISRSGLTLSPGVAKTLGVTKIADGPDGEYLGVASNVGLGPMQFQNCIVQVLSPRDSTANLLTGGLLGTDFFNSFLVTIDTRKAKVVFDPLPQAAEGENPFWVDAVAASDRKDFVPMLFDHGWLVTATLRDKPPMLMRLATASNISYVRRSVGNDLRLSSAFTWEGDNLCTQNCVSVEIGSRKRVVPLRVVEFPPKPYDWSVGTAGYLGNDYFFPFVVTFDFRNGYLKLDSE